MTENLINIQDKKTIKEKIIIFYQENKVLIFSILIIIALVVVSFIFYLESKEKRKILLSENYIEAKILIEKEEKDKAKNILEVIVTANDNTYSALALFLILNENLITDQKKMINLFEHLLKNNKFEEEIRNLITFKKILFQSNFADEFDLIEATRPIINKDSIWKPHALLLLGDYFLSKKQYEKAKDFYKQILTLNNLNSRQEFYEHAKSKLRNIDNE